MQHLDGAGRVDAAQVIGHDSDRRKRGCSRARTLVESMCTVHSTASSSSWTCTWALVDARYSAGWSSRATRALSGERAPLSGHAFGLLLGVDLLQI
jgi:hypothetical protein